jgi:hypothetical protein
MQNRKNMIFMFVLNSMNGANRLFVTDELVEFEK